MQAEEKEPQIPAWLERRGQGQPAAVLVRMDSRGLRKERFGITVREGKYRMDRR